MPRDKFIGDTLQLTKLRLLALVSQRCRWTVVSRARMKYCNVDCSSSYPALPCRCCAVDMREHLIDLGKQSVITRDTVQLDRVFFPVVVLSMSR